MTCEKNYKKEKQILLEFDLLSKDIRSQLGEQLRCLEHQIDSQTTAALELSEYFKKRAEIESEYTHGLDNLVKYLSQRIKSNSAKKDSLWHSHSISDLLSDLVKDTKQQAKYHAHFSELCSRHIPEKICESCDDSRRMLAKCKQVATDCHSELLKTLKEVQSSMKSYHEYQYSSRQAEHKLTTIQQQISKLKNKKLSVKYERRLNKRQMRYSDTKLKAFKARNDYILCIESSNAAINHYFTVDISDLLDCMNFGFHTSIAKCILMYISGQANVIRSRQLCVNSMNRSIADLDAVKDKKKFLTQYQSLFSANKIIKFEAHKGDEVSLIHAQVLLKDEMQQRFCAIENRLQSLASENEETFIEIECIEKQLMQLINVKNYDVTDLFKDLHFDPSCAKLKRVELENIYVEKFKKYTLTSNLIARLKMKHSLLQRALGQSSTSLSESRIVFRPNVINRIGKVPVIGRPRLFGGKLLDFIEATGQQIPEIIYSCIRAINRLGLHHQGIFRVSGSQVDINDFKEHFERGEDPLLSVSSRDMNSVAGVLKLYLRELKEPLFPREYFEDFINIVSTSVTDAESISKLAEKFLHIPAPIYMIMRYIFAFLNHLTEYSDENMMDANNIASCFAPTLMPVPEEYEQVKYLSSTIELMRIMVVHHDEILLNNVNEGPLYEKFPTSSTIGEGRDDEEDEDEDDDSNFNDELLDEETFDKLNDNDNSQTATTTMMMMKAMSEKNDEAVAAAAEVVDGGVQGHRRHAIRKTQTRMVFNRNSSEHCSHTAMMKALNQNGIVDDKYENGEENVEQSSALEPFFNVHQTTSSFAPINMTQLPVQTNDFADNAATQQQGNGYNINYDPEPHIVRRKASAPVVYKQEVAVRYLKAPTPPPPGPLIIKEVRANQAPPAPPVIIRQRPPRPPTPKPLIIRERPPQAPTNCRPKIITRTLPAPPPPPRRVIIERLPPLPPKPRPIIVERWLPYKQQKRRVIYQRAPQIQVPPQQKNLIIQWEGAQVKVMKEFRNLGVAKADPGTYVQKYGPNLRHTSALPDFAREAKFPNLAINGDNSDNEYNENFNGNKYGEEDDFDSIPPDSFLNAANVEMNGVNLATNSATAHGYLDPSMRADSIDFANIEANDYQLQDGFEQQQLFSLSDMDDTQHDSQTNAPADARDDVHFMNDRNQFKHTITTSSIIDTNMDLQQYTTQQ